jgi:guanylate kinase
MKGKIIIFSAPSGAGKTTIVKHLLNKKKFKLEFSISACSRKKRVNEIHGKDYYFLSIEEFKQKIDNNEFIEWEEVYKDNFYGSLKSEVKRITESGNNVIFDVDVIGGINIKKIYQERALSIFVMPPSIEELEKRLVARSTDSKDVIKTRLDKAKQEISYSNQFDKIIINDKLDDSFKEAENILSSFLL